MTSAPDTPPRPAASDPAGRPRIFQIGFNRCGTTTLALFLRENGISASHWRGGKIARQFFRAKNKNQRPFMADPVTTAYTDMIHVDERRAMDAALEFEYIYKHYPDSYYILNTRRREDWIRSRMGHSDTRDKFAALLGTDDDETIAAHWRQTWDQHHEKVQGFFGARPEAKFLVFDIDRHGGAEVAAFLAPDFPGVDAAHYGHFNRTPRRARVSRRRMLARALRRGVDRSGGRPGRGAGGSGRGGVWSRLRRLFGLDK